MNIQKLFHKLICITYWVLMKWSAPGSSPGGFALGGACGCACTKGLKVRYHITNQSINNCSNLQFPLSLASPLWAVVVSGHFWVLLKSQQKAGMKLAQNLKLRSVMIHTPYLEEVNSATDTEKQWWMASPIVSCIRETVKNFMTQNKINAGKSIGTLSACLAWNENSSLESIIGTLFAHWNHQNRRNILKRHATYIEPYDTNTIRLTWILIQNVATK